MLRLSLSVNIQVLSAQDRYCPAAASIGPVPVELITSPYYAYLGDRPQNCQNNQLDLDACIFRIPKEHNLIFNIDLNGKVLFLPPRS